MFQSFEASATPEQGPPRLRALRDAMRHEGLDGYLIPRADVHQGEYVAACDERLAWLTGFTGSAGFCAALHEVAGVFVDGRYRAQVRDQVAQEFTPVPWPETQLIEWIRGQLPEGGVIGFDPWLHTVAQVDSWTRDLADSAWSMRRVDNLTDRIWSDRPAPPMQPVREHPLEFAGESADAKIGRLAETLVKAGQNAAILTLPDSIMWLLNLRGADIERNPLAQCFAILYADARVDLFIAPEKLETVTLPDLATARAYSDFAHALDGLDGPVRVDRSSCPQAVADILGDVLVAGDDPCALPKACKNAAEIAGAEAAHLRDGAAVTEFLAWLSAQPAGSVTEIDVVRRLEETRRQDNRLRDISFDTIAGAGPNGAVIHYRVTEGTNRRLESGQLLVLDSGGQYLDGTTDITRTIAIGLPGAEERAAFTRVLQGMIAMSRLRWPKGLAGRDIEAVARAPLWQAGQDFNHGLGHGVGAYLSVHEGPQRLSRLGSVALEPGMILSNEPGYYREGAFGIRIENLLVVEPVTIAGGDAERAFLGWKTLTFAPIDRHLINADQLTPAERGWLNVYHAAVRDKIEPRLSPSARLWLIDATAPL